MEHAKPKLKGISSRLAMFHEQNPSMLFRSSTFSHQRPALYPPRERRQFSHLHRTKRSSPCPSRTSNYRPCIQRRIVFNDGSSSSQWPARRSAARRSATTCSSVTRASSCCSVVCAALRAVACTGDGRWPRRIDSLVMDHRRAAAVRR